jgi:hypothetical protein
MTEKADGEYELICDHCGKTAKIGFDTFDEAVRYKRIKKWKPVKTKTQGWVDLCPGCATPENIEEYRNR